MIDNKDYTRKTWIACGVLIIILLVVSLVPPKSIGEIRLRRANILSDLFSFDDTPASDQSIALDESEYRVNMVEVATQVAKAQPESVQTTYELDLWDGEHTKDTPVAITPDTVRLQRTLVPIENFDTTRRCKLYSFYKKLSANAAPVRIALLGDSFVEGDILSADLREKLQQTYGGNGAGFAPVASPLTAFRRTIATQSKGWTPYNIMKRQATPESLRSNYFVSGWVCQPTNGASVKWSGTTAKRHIDACNIARILFISRKTSRIEVSINNEEPHEFTITASSAVRQIELSNNNIKSVTLKVLSGAEGFIGYGAIFEAVDKGVVLDNYSIRSNNGQAMFWTNPSVNAQVDKLVGGYDLVILQYGLNIMQSGIRNYKNYSAQVEKMISFAQQCFPEAAILVMSVSDRMTKGADGQLTPIDAAPYLVEWQRAAAENRGVAFWNAYRAMGTMGGMYNFVANKWAGRDYTHINYAGGRQIAYSLFDAINRGVENVRIYEESDNARQEPLVDENNWLKMKETLMGVSLKELRKLK